MAAAPALAPAPPRFTPCLNLFSLWALPAFSTGPALDAPDLLVRLKREGYDAVQGLSAAGADEAGLQAFGVGRVAEPGDVDVIARDQRDAGFAATTVIVGDGLETDAEIDRLCDAVINASLKHGHALHVETHRGSITQDIRRTIDMIGRFPELRFTADLSHWYVGHDLASGDFDAKLAFMAPFFARVRFIQGRIGSPTCMQVAVRGPDDPRPFVRDQRRLWEACFTGFLANAPHGEAIAFAPELLPSVAPFGGVTHHLYFAQTRPGPDGVETEEADRWIQAGHMIEIGRRAFVDAAVRVQAF